MKSIMQRIGDAGRCCLQRMVRLRKRVWLTPREANVMQQIAAEMERSRLRHEWKSLEEKERKMWAQLADVNRVTVNHDLQRDVLRCDVSVCRYTLNSSLCRDEVIKDVGRRVMVQLGRAA